jgi:hypothetical protein
VVLTTATAWLLGLVLVVPGASAACPNEAIREAQHATSLPDCRAYEQVSPPDKNGGGVIAAVDHTRISSAGDAASFASLAGFADAVGSGVATEYMSLRGPSGWSTHAITPPQEPFTAFGAFDAGEPRYFGDFSPDLSSGVFLAWSLLSPAPNVENVENLYVRKDLRSPGPGSYALASDASAPVGSETEPLVNHHHPVFTGASADYGHVVFEASYPLTPESTAHSTSFENVNNVFEWDHGVVRLASVLPDGSPAPHPIAGQSASALAKLTLHTVSSDGSRVIFTDLPEGRTNDGAIYMRVDHSSTIQLNESERTDCSEEDPCQPPGGGNAEFATASADDSRVFFRGVGTERLTDDTPLVPAVRQLYMYDASKPPSDPHNLTLVSQDRTSAHEVGNVEGVIGASEDGRYVYFIAGGQHVAGAPQIGSRDGVFLWHDDGTPGGALSYVGELADSSDDGNDSISNARERALQARVSPDGHHVLFASSSGEGLLSAHGGTDFQQGSACHDERGVSQLCEELYLYDADTAALSCVSCDPSGAPPASPAGITVDAGERGATFSNPHFERDLSDDGRYVFFTTRDALVPQDVNGKSDVYEYDALTETVHLLSTGTEPVASYFMGTTPSGQDAFIATRSPLAGSDRDTSEDLYDVRVGGGFSEPASPPSPCAGEGCRGALASPPGDVPRPSATPSPDGNLLPALAPPAAKHKPLTRAQLLAKALRSCKHKPRRHRRACERSARRRYRPSSSSSRRTR